MEIIKKFIPVNHPNRPGRKLDSMLAVIVHFTGNDSPGATDTMNADWFSRPFKVGKDGKPLETDGSPFGYGSAQFIVDEDSTTQVLPINEVAWGCGDRPLPWTELDKGQQPAARKIFQNRQNSRTVSVEICNNGNWKVACERASELIIWIFQQHGFTVDVSATVAPEVSGPPEPGKAYILRHHDVTGKNCPAPFVADRPAWLYFVSQIAGKVNFKEAV